MIPDSTFVCACRNRATGLLEIALPSKRVRRRQSRSSTFFFVLSQLFTFCSCFRDHPPTHPRPTLAQSQQEGEKEPLPHTAMSTATLNQRRKQELKEVAQSLGIADNGTREDLVERIKYLFTRVLAVAVVARPLPATKRRGSRVITR